MTLLLFMVNHADKKNIGYTQVFDAQVITLINIVCMYTSILSMQINIILILYQYYYDIILINITSYTLIMDDGSERSEGDSNNASELNPFMLTVAFNICCPRDCVSRHNGGSAGAPLKPLRDDSALRALSTLRGLRGAPLI